MNRLIFKGVLDGIVVDRIIRDEDFAMPSIHFHPEYEIYYLLNGENYYFIENKTYRVSKGSLVLVDATQIHKTSTLGKSIQDRMLIELTSEPFSSFFEAICGMNLANFFKEHAGVLELAETGQTHVEALLNSITREFEEQSINYQSIIMMKIAELLLFVVRCKSDKRTLTKALAPDSVKHKRIHDIIGFILENYTKVKTLHEISKLFYINKNYLCRAFKEVTGSTVQDYINIHCIKKAQELLEDSDMRVSEISSYLGYGSVTYFERIFRKYTETTPLKYRRKMLLINQKVRERKKENLDV